MVATKRNEKYFHFGVKTPVMSGPICNEIAKMIVFEIVSWRESW